MFLGHGHGLIALNRKNALFAGSDSDSYRLAQSRARKALEKSPRTLLLRRVA